MVLRKRQDTLPKAERERLMVRIWSTSPDDMSCDRCRMLHGRREGDGWSMSGLSAESGWLPIGALYGPPPLHAHCRCRILVVNSPTPLPPSLGPTATSPSEAVSSGEAVAMPAPVDPLTPSEFPVVGFG